MKQLKDITAGTKFWIDRGFGPEELTAVIDAREIPSSPGLWMVGVTNFDGKQDYVRAIPTHEIKIRS